MESAAENYGRLCGEEGSIVASKDAWKECAGRDGGQKASGEGKVLKELQ